MPLSTTLSLKIKTILTKVTGLGAPADTVDKDLSDTLADGTGLNQADNTYSETRTLSANSSETLDLNGTALKNVFGDNFASVKLKWFAIHNKELTAGLDLQIGAGSSTFQLFGSASSRHTLGPDGILLVWEPSLAGKAVTAGSADLLMIRNANSSTVQYEFIAGSVSA